jgi:hypothetical protein
MLGSVMQLMFRLQAEALDLIRFDGQIKKLRHASEWLQSRVG